jgi:hypothetical protein
MKKLTLLGIIGGAVSSRAEHRSVLTVERASSQSCQLLQRAIPRVSTPRMSSFELLV